MKSDEYTDRKQGLDKEEKLVNTDKIFQQLINEVTEEEKRLLKTLKIVDKIGNAWYYE